MFIHYALIAAGLTITAPGPMPCFDISTCDTPAYYPYASPLLQQPDTGKREPKPKPPPPQPKPPKPQPPPPVQRPVVKPAPPKRQTPPPPPPRGQPELRRRKPGL